MGVVEGQCIPGGGGRTGDYSSYFRGEGEEELISINNRGLQRSRTTEVDRHVQRVTEYLAGTNKERKLGKSSGDVPLDYH